MSEKLYLSVEELSKVKNSYEYMAAAGEKIDKAVEEFSDIYSTLNQGHYKLFCEMSGKGLYDGYEIKYTVPKVTKVNEVIATVIENVENFENQDYDNDDKKDPDSDPEKKRGLTDMEYDPDLHIFEEGETEEDVIKKATDTDLDIDSGTKKDGDFDTKGTNYNPDLNGIDNSGRVPGATTDLPTLDDILNPTNTKTIQTGDKTVNNGGVVPNNKNDIKTDNKTNNSLGNGSVSFKNTGSKTGTILQTAAGVGGAALGTAGALYPGMSATSGYSGVDFLDNSDMASAFDDKYQFTSVDPTTINPAMDSGIIPNKKEDDDDDKKKTSFAPVGFEDKEKVDLEKAAEEELAEQAEGTNMESNTGNLGTILGVGSISAALGVGGAFLASKEKEKKKDEEDKKKEVDNQLEEILK